MGFGATTFVLSMYNVSARGIKEPNVVLGMALAYGGLVQLIAGIQEFVCGNTFAATAFSSYGGFWLSFASKSRLYLAVSLEFIPRPIVDADTTSPALYIPQFQVIEAYSTTAELDSALGIYLCSWGIVTFIFLIGESAELLSCVIEPRSND